MAEAGFGANPGCRGVRAARFRGSYPFDLHRCADAGVDGGPFRSEIGKGHPWVTHWDPA